MSQILHEFPSLTSELEQVRELILANISNSGTFIREALEDIILARGKMLRPAFLILTARTGKFPGDKIYEIAAALEMLHIATLVHDDIIDDADTRRGVATLHKRLGTRKAVLIGDFLFSRSSVLAARYTSTDNGKSLSNAVSLICESEIDQSSRCFSLDFSKRNYFRRIAGKTAALFLLAFHAGASESRMDKKQVMWARRAGYSIGMAFQIIDDILDCTGERNKLGKPAGNDIRHGIYTLPVIIAWQKSESNGELHRLLADHPYSEGTAAKILLLLDQCGALEESRKIADRYTHRALEAISRLPKGAGREQLSALARKLLFRSY
jgi:heptaprenyl diphosphate synthase